MADNLGTSVSVGQNATETYYVPGWPDHDAVRLKTDSANTASPDVTVEIRTYDKKDVRSAKDNSDFSSMNQIEKISNIDASSGDPIFGTDDIGGVVAFQVTENNNTSGDDYSGTIEFHSNKDADFESVGSWIGPYAASKELTQTLNPSPGFDSWTQADADRGTLITVSATAQTDGTSRGEVELEVDESGGTTADYALTVAHIAADNASGTDQEGTVTAFVPAGGQYRVSNVSDPNTANSLDVVRQVEKL